MKGGRVVAEALDPRIDSARQQLVGVVSDGKRGILGRCQCHDDHDPSLHVWIDDSGDFAWCCLAGCDHTLVGERHGYIARSSENAEYPSTYRPRAGGRTLRIIDKYEYVDERGAWVYTVGRTERDADDNKHFPAWRPDPARPGRVIWGLGKTSRLLYRLDEVARTKPGDSVWIAEGEKDVDALHRAGVVATCNPHGAGKWRQEYSEYLNGRHVIIVADRDEPGRKHAGQVAASLKGKAASVCIVEAAEGKDAADHLAAGYSLEEFVSVERPAPDSAEVNPIRAAFVTAPELAAGEDESVDWVLDDYIAPSSTTQLSGAPKLAGKTTFALCLADAVARGGTFMGRATKKGIVVYLSEQTRKSFKASARGTGVLENPDVHVLLRSRVWGHDWETIISEATAYCHEVGAVLLIVDTLGRWASLMGDAENDAGAALAVMQPLEEAAAAGLAVLVIRHDRKDAGANIVDAGRGSSAYAGAFDQLLSLKRVGGSGHENRRKLCSEGRFEETPRELQIEYAGGTFLDRGTEAGVESAEVRATLLAILPGCEDEARTRDHLLDACGGPAREATLVRVLGTEGDPEKGKPPSGLVGKGLVLRRKGAGAASARAYGYWLAPDAAGCEPLEMSDES